MRKVVEDIAKVCYILSHNRSLVLTGSLVMRIMGIKLDRDLTLSDVDFYETHHEELDEDNYSLVPFTQRIERFKSKELHVSEYACLQFETRGLCLDILGKKDYNFNGIDWFEPYSVEPFKETSWVSIEQLLKILVPDFTGDEFHYVRNYINKRTEYLEVDNLCHIGNAKLEILSNNYGDKLEYINIEKIKKDKHYQDLLKINEFVEKNPNIGVTSCKFNI